MTNKIVSHEGVRALGRALDEELTRARTRQLAQAVCASCSLDPSVAGDADWAGRLVRLALLVPDEALPDDDELDPELLAVRHELADGPHARAVAALRETAPRALVINQASGYVMRYEPGGLHRISVYGSHATEPLGDAGDLTSERVLTLYWPTRARSGGQVDVVVASWAAGSVPATLLAWSVLDLHTEDTHMGWRPTNWSLLVDRMLELVAVGDGDDPARLAPLVRSTHPQLTADEAERVARLWLQRPVLLSDLGPRPDADQRAHTLRGLTSLLDDASDPARPLPLAPSGSAVFVRALDALNLVNLVPETLPKSWRRLRLEERRRHVRQQVVAATSRAELDALAGPLTVARTLAITSRYANALPTDDELDLKVPAAMVWAELGCHPDGSMPGALDTDLQAEPVSRLRLPGGHPLLDDVPATAPLATALSWVRRQGRTPAAQAAHDAWLQFRRERRWQASLPRVRPEHLLADYTTDTLYQLMVNAIAEVYDPALGAHTIADLGLTRAMATRVHKALRSCRVDDRLDALPIWAQTLLDTPGFGPATFDKLVTALWQHLRDWRGTAPAIAGRHMAQAGEVQEGLDALAAMFGGEDEG